MTEDKREIVFAGLLAVDRLKFVEAWPKPTGLTKITRQQSALGGLVCNCAIDMAKLAPEVPVRVVGAIGEDEPGELILSEFSKYPSINTDMLVYIGETSYTDVITIPDGQRTFFQYPGATALLGPEHFDFAAMNAAILHIGYILLMDRLDSPDEDYPTGLCRVLDRAQQAGVLTSIDIVSETGDRYKRIASPALAYTDILSINDIEAEGITDIQLRDAEGRLKEEALEPCVRALAALGVKKWVCVHMPEVAAGLDVESGRYTEAEALRKPEGYIKSTVGAGDAFAVGLLYGAYRGISLEKAMEEANAVAAYSLNGIGASDAIAPLAEVLKVTGAWE